MTVIVGVDGGGTHTRIVAADLETGRLAFVHHPGTNPQTADAQDVTNVIASGILQAWDQLVMNRPTPGAQDGDGTADRGNANASAAGAAFTAAGVCAALAGAGRPVSAERMRALLESTLPAARVEVVTDAAAALAAYAGSGAGAVLLAGTGSIALAQDGKGSAWRVGGYGYLAGDEGSGFWVGRAGLAAAFRAFDGRGPGTSLLPAALAAFRAAGPPELLDRFYASGAPVRDIASFAGTVLDLQATDPVAGRIVEEALAEHAALVEALWRQARLERYVAVTGGLYRGRPEMLSGLIRHLRGAAAQWLDTAPVLGSLRLAARHDPEWSEAVDRWWDTWKTAGRNWV
jgi:N-acetylglucosamine kinase-like BadF-type ATPase